tara:strand:- start:1237 stop:1686 length:450 start_codon:yes stop_codon:yes gene_type:complete
MRIIDLIARAGRIGQKQDFYNTFVCVSSEVFDALIRQHPGLDVRQRSECDGMLDYREVRLPEPYDLEVCAMTDVPLTSFLVCVFNMQVCQDHLYQSNHERLLLNAQIEEALNDRLLSMTADEVLEEAQANGEDTASFAERMNELVGGQD